MAAENYEDALRRLLAHEGGYTNHPSDPGGPTNWGITIIDYQKYVNANATIADIRTMPLASAKAIYRAKYWNAMRCDELPGGVDYAVFDYGVNSGNSRAVKVLQRVLGVPATGHLDDTTLRLAHSRDARVIVGDICDERLRFLRSLRTWPVFGAGWARRVRDVKATGIHMAAPGESLRPMLPVMNAAGKGVVPINATAQAGSTSGVLGIGVTTATQGDPTFAIAILAVTIAVAVLAFLYWDWRRHMQQEEPV